MDFQAIKNICNSHPKAKEILKKVNGKRTYQEIAQALGVHPTLCSSVLSKGKTFGLLTKENRVYKKTPEFKHTNLDDVLKDTHTSSPKIVSPKVRKQRKIVDTEPLKKSIKEYIVKNFTVIKHPFSNSSVKIEKPELEKATKVLFNYLDQDVGLEQLNGLSLRFYYSFANYFSCNRIDKAEMLTAFGALIKCFEPYVKKVAAIKTNDNKYGRMSLNAEVISKAINFTSDIDKHQDTYWQVQPVKEASVRFVYPYRHKEAHEARDYYPYDIEKIAYYMFASIIFINLDS